MSEYTDLTDWYKPLGDDYVTSKELVWQVGSIGTGLYVRVPVGSRFDGTIPWYGRWYVDPDDPKYFKAFALHDYTLRVGWDRVFAAALMSDALRVAKVKRFKRIVMTVSAIIYKFR